MFYEYANLIGMLKIYEFLHHKVYDIFVACIRKTLIFKLGFAPMCKKWTFVVPV